MISAHPSCLLYEGPEPPRAFVDIQAMRVAYAKAVAEARTPRVQPFQLKTGYDADDNPTWQHARYSVGGSLADGTGGGVIFWAYSLDEAMSALAYCLRRGEYTRESLALWEDADPQGREHPQPRLVARLLDLV